MLLAMAPEDICISWFWSSASMQLHLGKPALGLCSPLLHEVQISNVTGRVGSVQSQDFSVLECGFLSLHVDASHGNYFV